MQNYPKIEHFTSVPRYALIYIFNGWKITCDCIQTAYFILQNQNVRWGTREWYKSSVCQNCFPQRKSSNHHNRNLI